VWVRWVAINTNYSSDVVDVIVVPRMRRSSVVKAMHIIQHRPILIKNQSCAIIKILKNRFQVAKWVGKVGGNRYNI